MLKKRNAKGEKVKGCKTTNTRFCMGGWGGIIETSKGEKMQERSTGSRTGGMKRRNPVFP